MKFLMLIFSVFMIVPAHGQLIDTLILQEEQSVLFASDQWVLDDEELTIIDSLFSIAETCDSIILEGHTDKIGSEEYNKKLSSKRVKSVFEKFSEMGISTEKIKSDRFGELMPAMKGEDESAFKLNRRVVMRFYQFEKRRKLEGKVEEEETKKSLLAKVKITGKNFVDSVYTNLEGNFAIFVPDNGVYKLEISSENHFFEQRFIKVSSKTASKINVGLPEIKIGSIYTLPNFNFKGDLPVLLPRSVPTLKLLFELLDDSDICIEIKGHINLPNKPHCKKDSRHYKLSVDRANMVYRQMISSGIDSLRMLPKGYGNWEMLFPQARVEQNMVKNRRVEIKIIDCETPELKAKLQD